MKRLLFLSITLLPLFAMSQRLHLDLFGGFSNYQGDLQDRQLTLGQSGLGLGAGLRYNLSRHFSVRGGLMYGTIGADDKKNSPSLQVRNLSFKSRLLEGNLMLEYNLFDMAYNKITPYVFGGIGLYHFNPYAFDTLGNKVYLKPLSTEGQGLAKYPDRKPYSLTQFALPFGGGIRMRISENVTVGYEIGLRKLFTDYLDDVSTNYVDGTILAGARGARAVEMAYRGGEIKSGNPIYPADGTKRGGSQYKDWYYFQGITISFGLHNNYGKRHKDRMGCPSVD